VHLTGGILRVFGHFSGFEFFLLPDLIHARPAATNASRQAAELLKVQDAKDNQYADYL
jgi:hypothetical protein